MSRPRRQLRQRLQRINFSHAARESTHHDLACRTSDTTTRMRTIRILGDKICTHKVNWRTARFPECSEAQSQDGENIMKRTHRLTLIAFTTLFVVTVAVLWASAPVKVSAQTKSPFPFAPRSLTGLASTAAP